MSERLYEKLRDYADSGVIPMHMPGHKRNYSRFPWLRNIDLSLDITETADFDNLNDPEDLFLELNGRLAAIRRADRSFALVNGSTCGILAGVKLAVPSGGKLLISRFSHKSLYSASEICGARLNYLVPSFITGTEIPGRITPESVEAALERNPDTSLVAITSPTYEGVISDVESIARVSHNYGIPLMVDAAHGAHLGFGGFSKCASELGADIVVESLHKTLPSPTQTAVLHINGSLVNAEAAQRCVSIFQSSSPSYILSAGIEACVSYMEENGEKECRNWLKGVTDLRDELKKLRNFELLDEPFLDPSKIVLLCDDGYEAMECFRRKSIEPEMAGNDYVLMMTGLGDTEISLNHLLSAARETDAEISRYELKRGEKLCLPEAKTDILSAVSSASEPVELNMAEGRISAEYIWKYPPGVPVAVPGEVVELSAFSGEMIRYHSTYGGFPKYLRCIS